MHIRLSGGEGECVMAVKARYLTLSGLALSEEFAVAAMIKLMIERVIPRFSWKCMDSGDIHFDVRPPALPGEGPSPESMWRQVKFTSIQYEVTIFLLGLKVPRGVGGFENQWRVDYALFNGERVRFIHQFSVDPMVFDLTIDFSDPQISANRKSSHESDHAASRRVLDEWMSRAGCSMARRAAYWMFTSIEDAFGSDMNLSRLCEAFSDLENIAGQIRRDLQRQVIGASDIPS
jgi:hypothetical protein